MTLDQIKFLAGMVTEAEAIGLALVGGIRSLVQVFRPDATDDELTAIVDEVSADAARRRDARRQMAPSAPSGSDGKPGDPPKIDG